MSPLTRVPPIDEVDATKETFRAPEVCALTGITYRQLDYWANTDVVRPSISAAKGSGTQRLYSATDVAVIRVLSRMLNRTTNSAHNDRLAKVRALEPVVRDLIESGATTVMLVVTVDGDAHVVESAEQLYALVQVHQTTFVITGFDLPDARERCA